MNSFTYGGLTCPANHTFCLEVMEDFSMGQINILGRVLLNTNVSPWWEDTFYEQGTQALVDTMDLVQNAISQTQYHLIQAQVEANLAKRAANILSSSSTRSAQYAYTWWDWVFRACVISSTLIFVFTLLQCCYFRYLLRSLRTAAYAAITLSPLQVPALLKAFHEIEELVKGIEMDTLIVTEEEQWEMLPKETIAVAIILEERLDLTNICDVLKAFVLWIGLLYIVNTDYPKHMKHTYNVLQKLFMNIGGSSCS
ncbi:sterile alpha motif domain-containing 3-like protein [Labeo rohita]|uniref:Sterile alpha motif domain-containing 3-like protein n=1 Tax=Labeo rohita TaxID=84645 RepID=A0A498LUD5_LABRO|nr:sterile alpha motif domain-containing 3-like protein [Labeo rohita]